MHVYISYKLKMAKIEGAVVQNRLTLGGDINDPDVMRYLSGQPPFLNVIILCFHMYYSSLFDISVTPIELNCNI